MSDVFKPYPSQQEVKKSFRYCADTGSLFWNIRAKGRQMDRPAGSFEKITGYSRIALNRQRYMTSRLIWIYHFGDIPDGMEIDHKDGNTQNNRIENLRPLSPSDNKANRIFNKNDLGQGVVCTGVTYSASIFKNGKRTKLGKFDTAELAHQAYCQAASTINVRLSALT